MKFCFVIYVQAVNNYGKDTVTTKLLDGLDFYVVPVVNIDGYIYTWTKVNGAIFLSRPNEIQINHFLLDMS